MHELSIAMSILEAAEEERRLHGGEVVAIHLRLGPLSGVMKEALVSAWDLVRETFAMPNADLKIEDVSIVAACATCGVQQPVVSMQEMVCSVCGAPATNILRGRELEITALELS